MIKIYDMLKPPFRLKCYIPDFVHYNKINSSDNVNCVQQNGRDYCLLPFSDLMVYTGKEVIWSDIPSVIEAHKIIKNRLSLILWEPESLLESQLNITVWKLYLTDKQILDLL